MKKFAKWLLLLVVVISVSQSFAQHGRYSRRYYDRYSYTYYRPYSYAPLRTSVSIVARLPFGAVAVTLGSRLYHYYDGLYYEPVSRGYAVVAPPMGVIVPVLPPSAVYIMIGGQPYYRYNDVYYTPLDNSRYQVVPRPDVEEAPNPKSPITNNSSSSNDGYEKFVLEGKTYYKKGSKYYKAKVADSGEIIYEEVGETTH